MVSFCDFTCFDKILFYVIFFENKWIESVCTTAAQPIARSWLQQSALSLSRFWSFTTMLKAKAAPPVNLLACASFLSLISVLVGLQHWFWSFYVKIPYTSYTSTWMMPYFKISSVFSFKKKRRKVLYSMCSKSTGCL